jgi:hypothetical protein
VCSTDRRVPYRRVSTGRPALDRSLAPLGNRGRSPPERKRSVRRRDRVAPSIGRTCRHGLARPKRPSTAASADRGEGTGGTNSGSVLVVRWDGPLVVEAGGPDESDRTERSDGPACVGLSRQYRPLLCLRGRQASSEFKLRRTDRSGVCLRFGVCILAATRCSSMLSDPPTPHWRRQQPLGRASGHPDRVFCDSPASLRAVHSWTVGSVGPWMRPHGTDDPGIGTTACRPWISSCRVEACSVRGCRPGPGGRGHTRE